MAGQGISRRKVLRYMTMAASVASFPGFCRWTFACGHLSNAATQIKPAAYRPLFFSAPEYTLVEHLADMIIPNDATPGAREAGVTEFIDLMASRDSALQHKLRSGLAWLNAHSTKIYGKPFFPLPPAHRAALLEPLAYKAKFRAGEEPGREFFRLFREYTVMGYYTSEVGLKELDFPGLQFYATSPLCPHTDDPEHLHLPAPQW
jgi:gluconate 2-dehydrogenase gamma chain